MDEDIENIMQICGGYWHDHPDYPSEDWRYHVANRETRLGYWEWVESQLADKE